MTTNVMVEIKTYRDCSIQVDHNGHFITVIGGETMDATTLRSLEDKIDDFQRAEAKQLSVDLSVLDGEGTPCRIIGINLGTGKVITRPTGAKGLFVVNVLDNSALVAEFNQGTKALSKLSGKVSDRSVKEHFSYGRITSDDYPEKMRELQNSYNIAVEITNKDHEFAEAVDKGIAKANERFADAE